MRLYATSLASGGDTAIIGGGLAGLGLAFNLLEKSEGGISITIYDKAPVGEGGASSVAGGYVPSLSFVSLKILSRMNDEIIYEYLLSALSLAHDDNHLSPRSLKTNLFTCGSFVPLNSRIRCSHCLLLFQFGTSVVTSWEAGSLGTRGPGLHQSIGRGSIPSCSRMHTS